MITIIDYETGNLGSIQNILKRIGEESVVTSDKTVISQATKLILPGVGSKTPVHQFGSSTIAVSIDVKREFRKENVVYIKGGTQSTGLTPVVYARRIEDAGAGEILLNSIDRDGVMEGYDIELIKSISNSIRIPLIACGGAGTLNDFKLAVKEGGASAVAAGSFFVFHGKRRAVLITYPSYSEISDLFN